MKNDKFLLTFEHTKHPEEMRIHTDLNGLENLIDELTKLFNSAKTGKSDHTHLMTEEWGGYELSSDSQGGAIINHVKVYCWNENRIVE
ncbi:MAG TPA: Imm32 family immunity protein [Pyrinomonadaceae bacterium]|nr:Imm32 family immunity protein [Pyrinomonadaceae bacterium]